MSEWFVRGWKVCPEKLQALVGSARVTPREVLESRANEDALEEVLMTLGDEDEHEGRTIAERALTTILGGKLKPSEAYEYTRATELLLNHVAKPLGAGDEIVLQLTYGAPNETFGRWNPLLEGLGLRQLARAWARENVAFPWSKGKPKCDWPGLTLLHHDELAPSAAELKPLTRKKLDALPVALLTDTADEAEAAETRDELWEGLKLLRTWIAASARDESKERLGVAQRGNALLLWMDGDQ